MFKIFRLLILILALFFISCSPLQHVELSHNASINQTLYDNVIIDIAIIGSSIPTPEALVFFETKITHYNISRRVVIRQRQNIKCPFMVWNLSLINIFENRNRQLRDENPNDRTLVIFICYLPGIYINGSVTHIAGIQYGSTSFAIFRDITSSSWEGVVLLHEFSHVLNIARAGNRRVAPVNPDRPNHCNDENCVMFWRAGEHRTEFCKICQSELQRLIEGKPLRRTRLY